MAYRRLVLMNNEQMAMVVLFEDLTTEKVNIDSLDEAKFKAEHQYKDDIIDWYVVNARGMRMT